MIILLNLNFIIFNVIFCIKFRNIKNACDKSSNLSIKKTRAPPPPFNSTYKVIFFKLLLNNIKIFFRIFQFDILMTHNAFLLVENLISLVFVRIHFQQSNVVHGCKRKMRIQPITFGDIW